MKCLQRDYVDNTQCAGGTAGLISTTYRWGNLLLYSLASDYRSPPVAFLSAVAEWLRSLLSVPQRGTASGYSFRGLSHSGYNFRGLSLSAVLRVAIVSVDCPTVGYCEWLQFSWIVPQWGTASGYSLHQLSCSGVLRVATVSADCPAVELCELIVLQCGTVSGYSVRRLSHSGVLRVATVSADCPAVEFCEWL